MAKDGSASKRKRGAPRKATRGQVLDIATRLINRRGVVATLLADVAREIGVTRMAMYQHVADREDLVFQCYVQSCDRLDDEVAQAASTAGGAIEQIRVMLRRLLGPEAPALCAIGIAGEIAASASKGNGSLQVNFLDELYAMDEEVLCRTFRQ